jgi:hypothetical protein
LEQLDNKLLQLEKMQMTVRRDLEQADAYNKREAQLADQFLVSIQVVLSPAHFAS